PALYDTTGLRTGRTANTEKYNAEGFTIVEQPSKKRKAAEGAEGLEAPPARPRGRPTKLSQKENGQQKLPPSLRRTRSAGDQAPTPVSQRDIEMQEDNRMSPPPSVQEDPEDPTIQREEGKSEGDDATPGERGSPGYRYLRDTGTVV
ncbi:MAG: hypothetical protein Q9228_007747, partial [Teloschistes exilis]